MGNGKLMRKDAAIYNQRVSRTFTVIILVAFLIIIVAFIIAMIKSYIDGSSMSELALLMALPAIPLLILVVVLLILSGEAPVQVTAYTALLAVVAGSLAWSVRSIKESLQNRAELLISEAVSRRPMDRDEIRAMVYANHMLFRANKATYVSALNNLLATKRVVLIGGRYSLADDIATKYSS